MATVAAAGNSARTWTAEVLYRLWPQALIPDGAHASWVRFTAGLANKNHPICIPCTSDSPRRLGSFPLMGGIRVGSPNQYFSPVRGKTIAPPPEGTLEPARCANPPSKTSGDSFAHFCVLISHSISTRYKSELSCLCPNSGINVNLFPIRRRSVFPPCLIRPRILEGCQPVAGGFA